MDEKYDRTTEVGRTEYATTVLKELKIQKIAKACEERDIETLISLATSRFGLVEDGYRRRACKFSDDGTTLSWPHSSS